MQADGAFAGLESRMPPIAAVSVLRLTPLEYSPCFAGRPMKPQTPPIPNWAYP